MVNIKLFGDYQINEAKENRTWVVTCYNKSDVIIKQCTIKDRTEQEAEKEAQSDIPNNADDWSLMPKKFWDDIKKSEKTKKNDQ
jgi:hypothetical protein